MLSTAVLVTLVPVGQGAYLVKPAPDTYLDFLTHLVYDGNGNPKGAGSELVHSNLDVWTKNEPMLTTATGFDVTLRPTDPSDPVTVEGVGATGICLHDYCISAEAFVWGDPKLATAPVMEIRWFECAPECIRSTSGPIVGKIYGNHLVWTGGFDPPAHKGAITNLCMYINQVPISLRCGYADFFGYGTWIQMGCVLMYGRPTCSGEVYIDE